MHRAKTWSRLTRVGLHVLLGLSVAALVFPFAPAATRLALGQRWSRALLDILGIALAVEGPAIARCGLVVANHVSWLDVIVLSALSPGAFVAKDDLRRWPVLGWLFARSGTLFLKRGSARAAWRLNREIAVALREGRRVAIFPEGTTTDGARLLAFYPALFQPAVDGTHPVQSVALAYEQASGAPSDAPVFTGDTEFWESLKTVAAQPRTVVRLRVAAALDGGVLTRRELARRTHGEIARLLASHFAAPRTGSAAPGPGDGRADAGAHPPTVPGGRVTPARWMPGSTRA